MATDATFDNQLQALATATANFANGKDAAIKNTIITALGGSTQSGGSGKIEGVITVTGENVTVCEEPQCVLVRIPNTEDGETTITVTCNNPDGRITYFGDNGDWGNNRPSGMPITFDSEDADAFYFFYTQEGSNSSYTPAYVQVRIE